MPRKCVPEGSGQVIDTERVTLTMIHELWTDHQHACPYLRHDAAGCFCTSPRISASEDRSTPCDHFSLQFWCLTEDRYTKCCLWPAGDAP